jgi:Cdc6-like AAA superfamily ATPase
MIRIHIVALYKSMPSSSSHFVGRSRQLEALRAFFKKRPDSDDERRSCALYGPGGVGKTQISLKFIEQNYKL